VLLYPEGMIKLNGSAGEIMKRCDGAATIADITADLERAFATTGLSDDVMANSSPWRWRRNGWRPCFLSRGNTAATPEHPAAGPVRRCGCCSSSPIAVRCIARFATTRRISRALGPELGTEDWLRVLREARALGAVQLGLSGGEPLARDDLEEIVAEAHRLGFYINLITSGVGLNETRLRR
jgi:hypothetical protein